ncbi:autotransporter outer membrane beta-barrel domain-containing protein [Ereboglobus luteus]|nr:autotransporter outer membrane beta-barrel domain-containing protein [Ereboglobus luteus]
MNTSLIFLTKTSFVSDKMKALGSACLMALMMAVPVLHASVVVPAGADDLKKIILEDNPNETEFILAGDPSPLGGSMAFGDRFLLLRSDVYGTDRTIQGASGPMITAVSGGTLAFGDIKIVGAALSTTKQGSAIHYSGKGLSTWVLHGNLTLSGHRISAAEAGAIYTPDGSDLNITGTGTLLLQSNVNSGGKGSAAYLTGGLVTESDIFLVVDGNSATGNGGALRTNKKISTITEYKDYGLVVGGSSMFINNNSGDANSDSNDGGGLRVTDGSAWFKGYAYVANNTAHAKGAGMTTPKGSMTFEDGATFIGNVAYSASGKTAQGGGILASTAANFTGKVRFEGNAAISDSMEGVSSGGKGEGGAIYARTVSVNGEAVFKDNIAETSGGAIFVSANTGNITLKASSGDIIFEGNKAGGVNNAIHMADGSKTTLSFEANSGNRIAFYDPISGVSGKVSKMEVNKNGGAGIVLFDQYASDLEINTTVYNGIFQLSNGAVYGSTVAGSFSLGASGTLAAFKSSASAATGNGTINAADITLGAGSTLLVGDNGLLAINATTRDFSNNIRLAGWGTINAGGALAANEIIAGDFNSISGQTLALTDSLTLNSATIKMDLIKGDLVDPSQSINDKLIMNGAATLTFSGAPTIDFHNLVQGKYTIISAGGGISGWAAPTTLQDGASLSGRIQVTYDASANGGKDIVANIQTTNESYTWNPAVTSWDTVVSGVGSSDDRFVGGDVITFADSGVIGITSGVTVGQLNANVLAGELRFTGEAIVADKDKSTVLGATGALHKSGAGSIRFDNESNEFTGGIILSDGIIAFSKASQVGTTLDKIVFDTNNNDARILALDSMEIGTGETLVVGAGKSAGFAAATDKTFTLAGNINGTATSVLNINRAGGDEHGTVVLSGNASTYQGVTNINGGHLKLANTGQLGGSINVSNGAALSGGGLVTGMVNMVAGSIIQPGDYNDDSASILSFTNGFSFAAGSIYRIDLIEGADTPLLSTNDSIISGGAIDFGGTITLDLNNTKRGVYTIMTAQGGFTGATDFDAYKPIITVGGIAYSSPRVGMDYTIIGNDLVMTIDVKNTALHWTGAAGNTWGEVSNDLSWEDNTDSGNLHRADKFVGYDRVIFADSPAEARSILITGGTVNVADMTVDDPGDYTFEGGSIVAQGNYSLELLPPPGNTLTKNGEGTLTFQNDYNYFENGVIINQGKVAGTVSNLGMNNFYIGSNGSLHLNESGTVAAVVSSTFTGAGSLAKEGSGMVRFTGDVAVGKFYVTQGSIDLSQAGQVTATSLFSLAAGTVLSGPATITTDRFSHAGLVDMRSDTFGTLKIIGNYTGETDSLGTSPLGSFYLYTKLTDGTGTIETDKILITGDASGKALVRVANKGGQGGYTGKHEGEQRPIELISIDGHSTVEFKLQGRLVKGAYEYQLAHSDDNRSWYLIAPEPSPEVDAASIVPAMGRSMAFAGLANMQERLGEFRIDPVKRNSVWVSVAQNADKFDTGTLQDLKVTSKLIQFGALRSFTNLGGSDASLSVGLLADVTEGDSDLIHDKSSITGNQKAFGVFATYQNSGWYADAVVKYGMSKYTIRTFDSRVESETSNYTFSAELGRSIRIKRFGNFEPQAQFIYNKQNIDDMKDAFARRYSFEAADSAQARVGVRWHNLFDMGKFGKLIPWVRAAGTYEMLGKYDFVVSGDKFSNDLSGGAVLLDAGLTLEFSADASLFLSGAWASGAGVDKQRMSIGMRISF